MNMAVQAGAENNGGSPSEATDLIAKVATSRVSAAIKSIPELANRLFSILGLDQGTHMRDRAKGDRDHAPRRLRARSSEFNDGTLPPDLGNSKEYDRFPQYASRRRRRMHRFAAPTARPRYRRRHRW